MSYEPRAASYNLHSHSLLSDGVLLPSELAVRYEAAGYKTLAITDHADYSNIEPCVQGILDFVRRWPKSMGIKVLSGIELTHIPLEQFKPLAKYSRSQGIQVIIGHGETTAEPVVKGTNRAALLSDIDILAHPGRISAEDTKLAKRRGIFLEVTTRHGHNRSNSYVIRQALKYGAKLLLSHDAHMPEDIISPEQTLMAAIKSGLTRKQIDKINMDVAKFLKSRGGRR